MLDMGQFLLQCLKKGAFGVDSERETTFQSKKGLKILYKQTFPKHTQFDWKYEKIQIQIREDENI